MPGVCPAYLLVGVGVASHLEEEEMEGLGDDETLAAEVAAKGERGRSRETEGGRGRLRGRGRRVECRRGGGGIHSLCWQADR